MRAIGILLALLVLGGGTGCGRRSTPEPARQQWGLMQRAVDADNPERVAALLGASPELVRADDGDGHSPLHVAADAGHDAVARVLLEYGARVDGQDSCGWTPLHTAAGNGHRSTAILLIEAGADVNATDHQGQTPLALALKWDHQDVAALLRAHGGHEQPARVVAGPRE
ncbi:ankyrin repeat domain-containing protein [bacterium]|nr:ankyrin repeat domain-containing protein [bacterium]